MIKKLKSWINKKKTPTGGMIEENGFADIAADVIIILTLLVIMFIAFIPLWHSLMSSLSDGRTLLAHNGLVWWYQGKFNPAGYQYLFKDDNILRGYMNSIIYASGTVLVGLTINVIAGYVLSRKVKLKPFIMIFILFTIMFSGGMIPTYMVVRTLGLTGTRLALIIPGATNAMFVIISMNAFLQVPQASVEAAEIDGAGHFNIMFRVMLPQALGLTIVTIINTAILSWNSWFEASIYIPNQRRLWPLQLWIRQLVAQNQDFLQIANPDYNRYLVQYAVIIVATLPVLIAMPFAQKQLQKGMLLGGVKE